AVVYARALRRGLPQVIRAVDRFVVPSEYAAGQVALLGLPGERVRTVPHYLPADAFASHSRADEGRYALVAGRLSPEKGIDTAIEAAARARVPLRIAGEGPIEERLRALARELRAPVEFLGRLDRRQLADELSHAAMLLLP